MSDLMQFEDKETVLCFHGPLIYEAKVFICVLFDLGVDFESRILERSQ